MKGIQFDNAAQRKTYVGTVYQAGVQAVQERVLSELPQQHASLHREGAIHIHDLEAYGQTYNCLQVDVLRGFPWERLACGSDFGKITGLFAHYRDLIEQLGNEQSGGIGFPNFDLEMETLFARLGVRPNVANLQMLRESIAAFIEWNSFARHRCGQTTYYVSLNLGLATGCVGRFTTRAVLESFRDSAFDVIKPNIIFKVKNGINHSFSDPNRDLLDLAMGCASRKMIPTFLLFDAASNASLDPLKVAIMGCRTRVVANQFGEDRSVGRGNIAYATINLPRLALEVEDACADAPVEEKLRRFLAAWTERSKVVRDILLDRYRRLLRLSNEDFPCNQVNRMWLEDFGDGIEAVFRNGTLSLGFIGLSEAMEVLTGTKFYATQDGRERAQRFVRAMRRVVDGFRADTGLNFTLLASSGEYISGRFPSLDRKRFDHPILRKAFYTNSFHVEVDAEMGPFEKLEVEGPFHGASNGGCISYVELDAAPLDNVEAVGEILDAAVRQGVSYLGFNFPLDRCLACGARGTFDLCPSCGGQEIRRIRRVSGYLEDLAFFTPGKKAEAAHRRPNATLKFDGGR